MPVGKLDDELASDMKSAPRLVIFLDNDGNMEEAVVIGDSVNIFTKADTIFEAIVFLVATYYVVDLQYPKPYCNILGLLQQFVVGEGYTGDRSSYYTSFIKKHHSILSD